jgi:hypothetical protein
MKIDVREILLKDYTKGQSILNFVTDGKSSKWGKDVVYHYLKKNPTFVEKQPDEEIELMVQTSNIMVKSPDCPNNIKNRFYVWKHRFIKHQLEIGNVSEIWESPEHYAFVLRNGIVLHQLKNTFPHGVPFVTKQVEYERHPNSADYHEPYVMTTMLQMALQCYC